LAAEFRYLPCTLRSHPVTSNFFPEFSCMLMANWTFLTIRAWALLRIAHYPEVRLRDFAPSRASPNAAPTAPSPTSRAGFAVKQKNRRHNRYETRAHVLALLAGTDARP